VRHAPVDGLLGFSQGAAATAALCALQQRERQQQERQRRERQGREQARRQRRPSEEGAGGQRCGGWEEGVEEGDSDGTGDGEEVQRAQGPRFAILLSGFPSPAPGHAALLAEVGPLALPSLHVFAAGDGAGSDGTVPARGAHGTAAVCEEGGSGAGAAAVPGGDGGGGGGDCVVPAALSEALAAAFDPVAGRRLSRRTGCGHSVPRAAARCREVREFLLAQRRQSDGP
jgi:hypothetical protein